MLNYNFDENMNYDFNHQAPLKKSKGDKEETKVVKKDRTIKIPKLYEF